MERDDFFAIEKSWLKLVQSYELSERIDRFVSKDFPKHSICPSCAVPMWLVEMDSTQAGLECRYQCKVCDCTTSLRDGEPLE